MIGLLFSGQGAQKTGLTQDLYDQLPLYRQAIDKASEVLQFDISELMFDSQYSQQLAQTKYSQPVILAMSWGLYQLLQPALATKKVIGLGLSLGEYSALACGDYLDIQTALRVIKRRGELMQQASEQTKGKMIAVMKSDLATVQQTCNEAQSIGIVAVANVNTPGQIVVGGQAAAVDYVADILTNQQEARIIPLKVSGAFHTPLMQPIQANLEQVLNSIKWQAGTFPVISTTTKNYFEPSDLTNNLTQQLVSSTYFADTFKSIAQPLDAVIEVGPGKTLLGFARKIAPTIARYRVDSLAELEQTIQAIGA